MHTGGAHVVGMHTGGPHTGGPHTGGAHIGGAQLGGAQTTGAHTGGAQRFGGGGANNPPITADGSPITAPHMFVHTPSNPPSKAKGPPVGPHDGGAQTGGAHTGGAHTGAATGGPPAIPTDGQIVINVKHKIERTATNLSAIPHPPFVRPFIIWLSLLIKGEGI